MVRLIYYKHASVSALRFSSKTRKLPRVRYYILHYKTNLYSKITQGQKLVTMNEIFFWLRKNTTQDFLPKCAHNLNVQIWGWASCMRTTTRMYLYYKTYIWSPLVFSTNSSSIGCDVSGCIIGPLVCHKKF